MDARGVLDLLDLTLLDHEADDAALDSLCKKANEHRPAAVCVFSEHAPYVGSRLDDGVALAAVAAGFPVGDVSPEEIAEAIREAVASGAEEVDCVLEPREGEGFPDEGDHARLIAMREASQGFILKVIIEAPLLDERRLRAVTRMVLAVGADFVKSCTGKRGGCSDEVAGILAYEAHRHGLATGDSSGVKLSGGIGSKADAKRLIGIVTGQDPSLVGSHRLRIGASSLLEDLVG
jgi:deoxyribose-phosphate aldolase